MGIKIKTQMFKTTLAASLVLMAAHATTFNQLYTNELSEVFEDEVNLDDYNLQPITCTPPGTYEYTTRDNKHKYFNNKDYQSLDAETKQDRLWTILSENDSVACQTFGGMEDLFRQKPQQSFNSAGDQMPTRMLMGGEEKDPKPRPDRLKMAHQ